MYMVVEEAKEGLRVIAPEGDPTAVTTRLLRDATFERRYMEITTFLVAPDWDVTAMVTDTDAPAAGWDTAREPAATPLIVMLDDGSVRAAETVVDVVKEEAVLNENDETAELKTGERVPAGEKLSVARVLTVERAGRVTLTVYVVLDPAWAVTTMGMLVVAPGFRLITVTALLAVATPLTVWEPEYDTGVTPVLVVDAGTVHVYDKVDEENTGARVHPPDSASAVSSEFVDGPETVTAIL